VKYRGAAELDCEMCHRTEVSANGILYIASTNHKLTKIRMKNHGQKSCRSVLLEEQANSCKVWRGIDQMHIFNKNTNEC